MDVDQHQHQHQHQAQGQALIEFIIFLPFLVGLLALMYTIAGAINGSINQQKAARGYFYNIIANNSTLPLSRTVYGLKGIGATNIGVYSIGWMDEIVNNTEPVAPCYQINSLIAGELNDQCKEPFSSEKKSRFIKVFTMYGVCGNLYTISNKGNYVQNVQNGSTSSACVIAE